jgi:hypothetical protein
MDYHLKATSEQALWTALIESGVAEEITRQVPNNGEEIATETIRQPKPGQNLGVIGEIWKPTGKMIETVMLDETTREIPEMAPVAGFHANLRGGLSEEQVTALGDVIIPAPATPYRVWA